MNKRTSNKKVQWEYAEVTIKIFVRGEAIPIVNPCLFVFDLHVHCTVCTCVCLCASLPSGRSRSIRAPSISSSFGFTGAIRALLQGDLLLNPGGPMNKS